MRDKFDPNPQPTSELAKTFETYFLTSEKNVYQNHSFPIQIGSLCLLRYKYNIIRRSATGHICCSTQKEDAVVSLTVALYRSVECTYDDVYAIPKEMYETISFKGSCITPLKQSLSPGSRTTFC